MSKPLTSGLLHEKLEALKARGEAHIFGVSSVVKRTTNGRGHFKRDSLTGRLEFAGFRGVGAVQAKAGLTPSKPFTSSIITCVRA